MLYLLMLAFQLAGALLLLVNHLNSSQEAIIRKCFPGSNTIERNELGYGSIPKEKLQKSAEEIIANIVAFVDLVVGYGIASLSPSMSLSKMISFFVVVGGSVVIIFLESTAIRYISRKKYSNDLIVQFSELEKYNVDTILTEEEIDDIIKH